MKLENPRFLIKSLESIKAVNRKLSKKIKGSRRFNKLNLDLISYTIKFDVNVNIFYNASQLA